MSSIVPIPENHSITHHHFPICYDAPDLQEPISKSFITGPLTPPSSTIHIHHDKMLFKLKYLTIELIGEISGKPIDPLLSCLSTSGYAEVVLRIKPYLQHPLAGCVVSRRKFYVDPGSSAFMFKRKIFKEAAAEGYTVGQFEEQLRKIEMNA